MQDNLPVDTRLDGTSQSCSGSTPSARPFDSVVEHLKFPTMDLSGCADGTITEQL